MVVYRLQDYKLCQCLSNSTELPKIQRITGSKGQNLPIYTRSISRGNRAPRWWSLGETWVCVWGKPRRVCPPPCKNTSNISAHSRVRRRAAYKRQSGGICMSSSLRDSFQVLCIFIHNESDKRRLRLWIWLHLLEIFLPCNLHLNVGGMYIINQALTASSCGGSWSRPAPATDPFQTSNTRCPPPPGGRARINKPSTQVKIDFKGSKLSSGLLLSAVILPV